MMITHLSLTNFRNYSRLELDLPEGITLLQGDNAQGKTNLLESIYYLVTTRSPQAGSDWELINWLVREDPIAFTRLGRRHRSGTGNAAHRADAGPGPWNAPGVLQRCASKSASTAQRNGPWTCSAWSTWSSSVRRTSSW